MFCPFFKKIPIGKKKYLLCTLFLCFVVMLNGQRIGYGITTGFTSLSQEFDFEGSDVFVENASVFYIGGLVDVKIKDAFYIQSETRLNIFQGNERVPAIAQISALGNYLIPYNFSLLFGPQISVIVSSDNDFDLGVSLNLGLSFGVAYDLSEHFFLELRYSLEFGERATEGIDTNGMAVEGVSSINTLSLGFGYRF